MKGKGVAVRDDAVKALTENQVVNLQEVAEQLADTHQVAEVSKSEDITQSFIETVKFIGPDCLASNFLVYRGLVQQLSGRVLDPNAYTLGIIAGKNDMAIEVCLGGDVASMVSNNELKER